MTLGLVSSFVIYRVLQKRVFNVLTASRKIKFFETFEITEYWKHQTINVKYER